MIQLLLLFILLALIFYGMNAYLRRAPPSTAMALRRGALWIGGLALLFLIATGRLHWLMPLLAALLAAATRLLPVFLQFIPLWQRFTAHGAGAESRDHARGQRSSTTMSREEAYEILGLKPGASRQEIITAHRRLMQKVHPDRGGSDYLAAKINKAKDILLS